VHLRSLLGAAGLGNVEVVASPVPGVSDAVVATEGTGPEVTDVVTHPSQVSPGALFACVKGSRADGHDYARDAVERGAVAVLCERVLDLDVPQVLVPSVRRALGPVSAAAWSHPSSAMRVVGVTGTNGKTTTCAIIAAIFEAQGWRTGVIGTLSGERTTPEAPDLQRRLAKFRDEGAVAVAMEVSSHAIDQHRVDGTRFAAAVFTNLSQDHLDYHVTMEAYFEVKARLFTPGRFGLAVVNRADPWGARLVERLTELAGTPEGEAPAERYRSGGVPVVTYCPQDASDVVAGRLGSSFSWRGERLVLNMGGSHNVANAVAAATTASALGASREAVAKGLASVQPVRGRFEVVDEGQPFGVLVDFAHTPGALAEALRSARELTGSAGTAGGPGAGPGAGRVIVVFGAGGDRDRAKRPLMARVASQLSDIVVVTSDNPRSEQPLDIIEQVVGGVQGPAPLVEVDRANAIARAIGMAGAGDVVLIAGKGHETGQDFGSHVEAFDDVEVARSALLRARLGAIGAGKS